MNTRRPGKRSGGSRPGGSAGSNRPRGGAPAGAGRPPSERAKRPTAGAAAPRPGSPTAGSARGRDDLSAGFRRDRRLLVAVVVGLAVVLIGGGLAFQTWRTGRDPVDTVAAPSLAPATITTGRPILFGAADAPVRLRLYEDFHCPHCADFEELYAPTLDAAVARGEAVVELYPMAFIDDGSARASNAMACATEAGFGRAFYTGLFANVQLDWSADQLIALGRSSTPAGTAVPATFEACVRDDAHRDWVDSINAAADAAQVAQTPTLFIDDQPVDIAQLTPDGLAADIARAAAA